MNLTEKMEYAYDQSELARKAKEVARKSNTDSDSFLKASELYKKSAYTIFNEILNEPIFDFDLCSRIRAFGHYYRYEESICLYSVHSKNGKYNEALDCAKKAKVEIKNALDVVHNNFDLFNEDSKKIFEKTLVYWEGSALSVENNILEPIFKKAMTDKDYIIALDTTNLMLENSSKEIEYKVRTKLDPVFIRIAKGNYIGMAANTNIAMINILEQKIKNNAFNFDIKRDLIKNLLNALELSHNAFDTNPEWDQYRSGAEQVEKNIRRILNEDKDKWFEYMVQFNNNINLKRIMQQTDIENYKKQAAKLELENNSTKKFFLVGLFWIALFFCVLYGLMHIATSSISWPRFIALLLGLPIIVTILGAFILRTTDSLKEENFIKLMQLALKINFKGLKALIEKK